MYFLFVFISSNASYTAITQHCVVRKTWTEKKDCFPSEPYFQSPIPRFPILPIPAV